jgi:hypothetical protein
VLTLILTALLLPPLPAARIAARALDVPEKALVRIVLRESQGVRVGIHERDAWASDIVYRKAVRAGWLDPQSCPFHREEPTGAGREGPSGLAAKAGVPRIGRWSTRGAAGLMAAYNLRWLGPVACAPPWVLDVPIVSAVASARRYRALCPSERWRWC